jgi:serine/threonine protein kinase
VDIGLAHRDVKPANLMVQDGHLRLIDVSSCRCARRRGARPSTSRHAAGARAAVRRRPGYTKALEYFTPDELAEAFAATRGVASPTQLRRR